MSQVKRTCKVLLPTVRQDVCPDCPFRRKAARGWLGGNRPEEYVLAATSDESVACHEMVDQTLPREKWVEAEAAAPRCRGALIMRENGCKMPRDPAQAALQNTIEADTKTVFTWPWEFVQYHEGARVKSWALRDKKGKEEVDGRTRKRAAAVRRTVKGTTRKRSR